MTLRRRFVDVDGRRVHYLRMGEGPPVVLIHSSPTNAWYVAPHMRHLADRFTCFAFDSPGFGLSDALPGDSLDVSQLSGALADNMVAAGLPPCPVYGTHTGAAIALSLAAHHPERVTALVLDGVPIFTEAEKDSIFQNYFEPLVVDDRGGHFARAWTRFRDQYLWFPWTRRTPDRHNDTDLGTPAAIHSWTESFFYCGSTYKAAYRAACFYGDQAVTDSRIAACPVVYTATESDMLYGHLERLLPLPPLQEIRRIGDDRSLKDPLIGEYFDRHPAAATSAPDVFVLAEGPGVRQQFVDRPVGQVLLRHAGPHDAPVVVVLHDAPGSAESIARPGGLVERLSASFLVLAPDLPGCGGSDPVGDDVSLDAFADAVAQVCTKAGVERCCVYGIGIGASVALRVARRHPSLVDRVVVRGLALPTLEERGRLQRRYAPPITIEPDGSHWYRTWLMLRDQQVFFPWYANRATDQRRVQADFGAEHLHRWTFEVMKQHRHYHEVVDAAFACDAADDLAALRMPLAVCHDPQVPFFAYDGALRALTRGVVELPEDDGHVAALGRFVADRSPARSTHAGSARAA